MSLEFVSISSPLNHLRRLDGAQRDANAVAGHVDHQLRFVQMFAAADFQDTTHVVKAGGAFLVSGPEGVHGEVLAGFVLDKIAGHNGRK